MKEGYSRLLINELIVGAVGADRYETSVDITMAALLSAAERTEQKWADLLHSAGFAVVKVWRGYAAKESVIEAEPV